MHGKEREDEAKNCSRKSIKFDKDNFVNETRNINHKIKRKMKIQ